MCMWMGRGRFGKLGGVEISEDLGVTLITQETAEADINTAHKHTHRSRKPRSRQQVHD